MHNFDSSNVEYSELSNEEIQNIKEVEEKINQNRTGGIILLAVESK